MSPLDEITIAVIETLSVRRPAADDGGIFANKISPPIAHCTPFLNRLRPLPVPGKGMLRGNRFLGVVLAAWKRQHDE